MSDFNIEDENTRLPLPAPRPDSDLDDKILAYARANAPTRETHGRGRWVAGLATAGIVAVAIMITLPVQIPSTAITGAAQYAEPAPESAAAAPAAMKSLRRERSLDLSDEPPVASPERMSSLAADIASESADITRAARVAGAGAAESAQALSPENLARELDLLGDKLASGAETEARAAYQQLRTNCADCQLPATLEQALFQHEQVIQGNTKHWLPEAHEVP